MPQFDVTVTETITHERVVEATDEESARAKAEQRGTTVGQEYDTFASVTNIDVRPTDKGGT